MREDGITKAMAALESQSRDGWWDWWIQEDYEYMSPRFWEIFGYDPETKRHHPSEWQELIHPDDLPGCLENFAEHVATHGSHPYEQEVRYRHADGHWVWVLCRGEVTDWEGELPVRMVGTHTDITELKKLKIQLAQTKAALSK